MPAALPVEIRQEIVQLRQQGESFGAIAEKLGRSYETVRGIWRHWQQYGTLKPNYDACHHTGPRKKQAIYEAAIAMKRDHRRWGAQVIRLKLEEEFAENDLPSIRTLQTWFRKAGVNRRVAVVKTTQSYVKRGQTVHEVWAVDAKEQMKLGDGSPASWLTITDEASGAILHAAAFPPQELDTGGSDSGAPADTAAIPEVGPTAKDAF